MNASMLKSQMILNGDTLLDLAEYLHISYQSLCNKINEKGTEFKQGEIAQIKKRYNLSAKQVESIFFT